MVANSYFFSDIAFFKQLNSHFAFSHSLYEYRRVRTYVRTPASLTLIESCPSPVIPQFSQVPVATQTSEMVSAAQKSTDATISNKRAVTTADGIIFGDFPFIISNDLTIFACSTAIRFVSD